MFEARVGVKEPHLLQKHWVSPRLKIARSGQGRRRLKIVLLFHKAGEKLPPPSAKIRSRCWSRQIFGATAMGFLIVGTIRSLSSAANMTPACQESELMRGLGIPASSSLPSLVPPFASASSSFPSPGPSWCIYFFFFFFFPSINGVILSYIIATRAKLRRICRFLVSFYFCFCNQLLVQACLNSSLYAVLFLCINKR